MTVGSTLPPVERRVLRQDILLGLRSGILSGEIAPGTRLLEIPLATELGVSRGPVREALRQLEQEGLVEFYPHRGAIVVGVGETEIETIYAIRALLEERAFAKAARSDRRRRARALAGMVEKMIAASEDGDAVGRRRARHALPRPGRRAVRVLVPAPAVDEHRRRRPAARGPRRRTTRDGRRDVRPRVAHRAVDRASRPGRRAAQPAAPDRRPRPPGRTSPEPSSVSTTRTQR